MARVGYGSAHHRQAFELWCQVGTFRSVADTPGMPSHDTVAQWAKKSYPCRCPWHGWEALKARRQEEVRHAIDVVRAEPSQQDTDGWVVDDVAMLRALAFIEKVAMAEVEKDEDENPLRPRSWSDILSTLQVVNKERRTILGEPSEIRETRVDGKVEHEHIGTVRHVRIDNDLLREFQQFAAGAAATGDGSHTAGSVGRADDREASVADPDGDHALGGGQSPDGGREL